MNNRRRNSLFDDLDSAGEQRGGYAEVQRVLCEKADSCIAAIGGLFDRSTLVSSDDRVIAEAIIQADTDDMEGVREMCSE